MRKILLVLPVPVPEAGQGLFRGQIPREVLRPGTEVEFAFAASSGIADLDAFLGRGTPMRRIGRPGEIVNVMPMMISPGNTFMSGQAIAVDGGSSAI